MPAGQRINFIAVIFFTALIAATRIPSLAEPILNIDEADFAVQTAVWQDGGTPYVDFVEKKPPLIHIAYAAAFIAGGTWNMQAVHILFAILALATGLLLAVAARLAAGPRAGIAALALFAVYQAGYDLNDFLAANTETLMNAALAGAAALVIAALARRRRSHILLAAGALAGVGVLAKPVAVAILPALAVADWRSRRQGGEARKAVYDFLVVCAGLAVPIAAAAVLLRNAGALDAAIRWVWTENIRYASLARPLSTVAAHGAVRLGIYAAVSLPLWALGAVRIVSICRRRRMGSVDMFLALWLIMSIAAVCLGGRFFPHYFLQLLPPLVLLGSAGWIGWLHPLIAQRRAAVAAAVALGLAGPVIGFTALHVIEIGRLPEKFKAERAIAAAIAAKTHPDSKIFVWGHSSDIYYHSRRLPASRFVYCSYLTGSAEGYESEKNRTAIDQEARRMAIDDLEMDPPDMIIDMSGTGIRGYEKFPLPTFPELAGLVARNYRRISSISGAEIFQRLK